MNVFASIDTPTIFPQSLGNLARISSLVFTRHHGRLPAPQPHHAAISPKILAKSTRGYSPSESWGEGRAASVWKIQCGCILGVVGGMCKRGFPRLRGWIRCRPYALQNGPERESPYVVPFPAPTPSKNVDLTRHPGRTALSVSGPGAGAGRQQPGRWVFAESRVCPLAFLASVGCASVREGAGRMWVRTGWMVSVMGETSSCMCPLYRIYLLLPFLSLFSLWVGRVVGSDVKASRKDLQ